MPDAKTVLLTRDGPIVTVTLNRPEKLNALSPQLLVDFDAVMDEVRNDPSAKVVILRGAGRAFSSGYDWVASSVSSTTDQDQAHLQINLERWMRLRDMPKPVIAMIHGYCLAGASKMAICCDVTFVAEDSRIGFPGLPGGAGIIAAPWSLMVGPQRAKYLAFAAGGQISGREAYEMGWAAKAFPSATLEEETYRYARRVAKMPPEVVRIEKMAVNRAMDIQGFRTAFMTGAEWNVIAHFSPATVEARQMVKEKGLRAALAYYQQP